MITIPTISQLYTDIKADIEAEYGESIPLFGKIFLRALAMVQAGKMKLYYLAIGILQRNIFVDTADPESRGGTLERFGRIKINRDPFPATAGEYTMEVTGTIGALIPASTSFKANDDALNPGKLFILDADHTLIAATDSVTLRALEAGLDSKLEVGDELTATAPIANVDKLATVTAESVAPVAAEDIEEYRQKCEEAYQLEAQGGAGSDYRLWAADVQGVKTVYPFATSGAANEVNVFVEATEADSTDGKGTPSAAILDEVAEVIEFDPDTTKPLNDRGRRPLTVQQVHCLAITPLDVDITINDFSGLTASIQTVIQQALEESLADVRPFVASVDVLADKNDILDLNKIIGVILNVRPGSSFGAIELVVDGATVSTYTFTEGNIPHLNSVTFA